MVPQITSNNLHHTPNKSIEGGDFKAEGFKVVSLSKKMQKNYDNMCLEKEGNQ